MRQFKISQSITNRDTDCIERYLNDISRISLLDIEDEVNLTQKIRNGDQAALHKLVTSNLRFVVSVAKKYQNKGLRLGDLISEGNLGLIKAAKRFDSTKGFKFITFAVWWIRQSIMLAIADQRRMVHLPGNHLVGIASINRASNTLEQELERTPTFTEISDYTAIPEDKIAYYMNNAQFHYSLDSVNNEDSGATLMDTVADTSMPGPDHLMLDTSLTEDIRRLLSILSKREQKIMMLFYGINGYPKTTLDDMAGIFKLSKERVRQLKDKAHKTLSEFCQNGNSLEFLF